MILIDGLTLEEAREIIKENKRPMESVIKWQTGTPDEGWGTCIITTISGHVDFAEWEGNKWDGWPTESIVAWCYIGNIEPYKE